MGHKRSLRSDGLVNAPKSPLDKRRRKAFQQPFMECCGVDCQQKVYDAHGLSVYSRNLPEEECFHRAVEAGFGKGYEQNEAHLLALLDIVYVPSMGAAMRE